MTRVYDLVVLGATGFTGQFVLEEIGKIAKENPELKFAIAGRNADKLSQTLATAKDNTGLALKDVGVIIVDVNNHDNIVSMAKQTKVVINCVGPYRFYGENVVKGCVETGTDHIDISGEPEYLEYVQLKYGEAAQAKNVHIVGACGFDSVPADMGTVFLQDNFKGDVNSVEMVVGFHETSQGSSTVNFTTMECAVHGFANKNSLKKVRRELFVDPLPKTTFRPKPRGSLFWNDEASRWCVPNLASDKSVVLRTQRLNYKIHQRRPVQFAAFFGMQSIWTAFIAIFMGLVFGIMASCRCTRKLLLRFPEICTFGVFSRTVPRRDDLKNLKFCVSLTGQGWDTVLEDPEQQHNQKPNITKTVQVIGCDPGYFGTAIIVTQCAMTVLQEKSNLPTSGGVFTPGAAFLKTSLIQRLQKKGISFSFLE